MYKALRMLPLCFAVWWNVQTVCSAEASVVNRPENAEPLKTETAENSGVVLYNFSEDLLRATEDCTPYQEDFTANNPSLKQTFADDISNADLSVSVQIHGIENDLCHFSVQYGLMGQDSVYECRINATQRAELVSAMKDRSPEQVTETFESAVQEVIDDNGKKKYVSTQTTVSGGHFIVTAAKLQLTACRLKMQILSEEEQEELDKKARMLPEAFAENLKKCESAHTKYKLFVTEENVDVIGWEGDKCHLEYRDFDLYVPKYQLKEIQTFDDIANLLAEPNIAKYNYMATYNYEGMLFELAACYQKQKTESNHKTYVTYSEGVDVISGVASVELTDDYCLLELVNVLRVRDKVTDYGVLCEVPTDDLERLVAPHLRLVEIFGEKSVENADGKIEWQSSVSNEQTKYADGLLMYDIQQHGYCWMKNDTLPEETTEAVEPTPEENTEPKAVIEPEESEQTTETESEEETVTAPEEQKQEPAVKEAEATAEAEKKPEIEVKEIETEKSETEQKEPEKAVETEQKE